MRKIILFAIFTANSAAQLCIFLHPLSRLICILNGREAVRGCAKGIIDVFSPWGEVGVLWSGPGVFAVGTHGHGSIDPVRPALPHSATAALITIIRLTLHLINYWHTPALYVYLYENACTKFISYIYPATGSRNLTLTVPSLTFYQESYYYKSPHLRLSTLKE